MATWFTYEIASATIRASTSSGLARRQMLAPEAVKMMSSLSPDSRLSV